VRHYLVKWRSLQYEDSTWELEEDVDPEKIAQFGKFNKAPVKEQWKVILIHTFQIYKMLRMYKYIVSYFLYKMIYNCVISAEKET
jgi:anion-transporting  ArsA/GET3 family ATPase